MNKLKGKRCANRQMTPRKRLRGASRSLKRGKGAIFVVPTKLAMPPPPAPVTANPEAREAMSSSDRLPPDSPPSSSQGAANSIVPSSTALPSLCEELTEICTRRNDFVRAQGNLDRQIKQLVARATGKKKVTDKDVKAFLDEGPLVLVTHLSSFVQLRDEALAHRKKFDKLVQAKAKELPAYGRFVLPTKGFGLIGFGQIVGEAGDLANYSEPCRLWRRFGLHVIGGKAPSTWKRMKKSESLSKSAWSDAGYSPRRRSLMFVVADSLLRNKNNPYRAFYLAAKELERTKALAEGLIIAKADEIPKGEWAKYRSLKHIDLRARRKVAKRLLRDLWRSWNGQGIDVIQHEDDPTAAKVPRPRRPASRGSVSPLQESPR
ncbi:MAG: hypothetical protein KGL39_15490 [Patescibacteria group bacterium]|nr:hypothetical protein [Patescibacteria group bacterium]